MIIIMLLTSIAQIKSMEKQDVSSSNHNVTIKSVFIITNFLLYSCDKVIDYSLIEAIKKRPNLKKYTKSENKMAHLPSIFNLAACASTVHENYDYAALFTAAAAFSLKDRMDKICHDIKK